jgi:hypothetical protein
MLKNKIYLWELIESMLLNYCELKHKRSLKCYLEVKVRAKRRRIKLKAKISKLQRMRRGYEKGRCPLHLRSRTPNIVIKMMVKVQVKGQIHI